MSVFSYYPPPPHTLSCQWGVVVSLFDYSVKLVFPLKFLAVRE